MKRSPSCRRCRIMLAWALRCELPLSLSPGPAFHFRTRAQARTARARIRSHSPEWTTRVVRLAEAPTSA